MNDVIEEIKKILGNEKLGSILQVNDLNDSSIYISLIETCTLDTAVKLISTDDSEKMLVISNDEFYGTWYAIWKKTKKETEMSSFNDDSYCEPSQNIDIILTKLTKQEVDLILENLNRKVIDSI
ncbi:MAG: hypothetical protein GY870_16540 [archaeon]|nr:hypothetical protein [archaeon]